MRTRAFIIIALLAGCDQFSRSSSPTGYQTAAERYQNETTTAPQPEPVASSDAVTASPPTALANSSGPLPPMDSSIRTELDELRRELHALRDATRHRVPPSTAPADIRPVPPVAVPGSSSQPFLQPGSARQPNDENQDESRSSPAQDDDEDRLDDLVWEYRTKREDFLASEASYEIDAMMSIVKAFELLFRDTPLTFNVLPERYRHYFRDLQSAARALRPALKTSLRRMDASHPDFEERQSLLDEVESVIDAEAPGTGNRMLDMLELFKRQSEERHDASQSE